MSQLGIVEDTPFIFVLGRIYASEHCPQTHEGAEEYPESTAFIRIKARISVTHFSRLF